MYSNNECAVKIGHRRTVYFTQKQGVRQGCSLSPTLFNIYINELAQQLEKSTTHGPILLDTEVKFLLFADDLVLMSTTEEGLQEKLNILRNFCKTRALKINTGKTRKGPALRRRNSKLTEILSNTQQNISI